MKQFQPGRPCSAVIKAGKPQRCLPASFDFGRGPVVELRPMVGLISAEGGNQSPIAWERKRSQAVAEISLDSGSRSCPPITGGANRLPFIGSTNASIPQPAPKRNPLPERFGSDAAG